MAKKVNIYWRNWLNPIKKWGELKSCEIDPENNDGFFSRQDG
jgi:hypothetical protein